MVANAKKKNGAATRAKKGRAPAKVPARLDKLESDNVAFWREMRGWTREIQTQRAEDRAEERKRRAEDRAEERKQRAKDRADEQKWRAEARKQRAEDRAEEQKWHAEVRKQLAEERKQRAEERAEDRAKEQKWRAEMHEREAKIHEREAKMHERVAKIHERVEKIHERVATMRESAAKEEKQRAERNRELDRRIATIGDRLGGLTNAEGDIFEHECYEAVDKAKALGDVHFDFVRANVTNGYEYDVVGVNKKVVVPMEAKQTLRARDVRKFAKTRLREFPRLLPEYAEGRKVTGAMIFRRAPIETLPGGDKEDPIEVAMELGLMVVQAFGKNRLEVVTSASKVRRK